jgi:hypothetical protein
MFLGFCLLWWATADGQAQVNCTAKAPAQVAVGQPFTYSITLNRQPSKMSTIHFTYFDHLNGPSTSVKQNFVMSGSQTISESSYTYSYTLAAQKEGTFTIPEVSFMVDGQQIKSNTVTVKVSGKAPQQTQQTQQAQNNHQSVSASPNFDKNDVFIRGEVSKSTPYVGEQVTVSYKLYIGGSVTGGFNVNNADMPTQADLWSYMLGDPKQNTPPTIEMVEGKRYSVYLIRRNALFPQRAGKINISPLSMDITVGVHYLRQVGWMRFQDVQEHDLKIKSNAITLNVKELPQAGQPDDFEGISGNYKMTSSLSRKALKANEATNFVITISGVGNIQHLSNPVINFPSDFDVSDPRITDNINTQGTTVSGSRTFEYVIIPRNEGKFTISPVSYSYFDLHSSTYKTLATEAYELDVAHNDTQFSSHTGGINQKDIKILDKDIRYIKNGKSGLHLKDWEFFGTAWYWLLLFMPLLLLLLFILIWRKEIEKRKDIAVRKNRKANKTALKRLKNAKKLLEASKKEDFYVEISKALWGYMSDKFHIPLGQLSTETVEVRLLDKGVPQEQIGEFINTLNQCEFARFAPTGDSIQIMQDMYEKALIFITKIEK